MKRYALAELYEQTRTAARRGDLRGTATYVAEALGLAPTVTERWLEQGAILAPPERCVSRLRYRGFKPAELAMLAADLKPVVKFEDIPAAKAQAFVARFGDHYRLHVTPPYYKDRLLLRTRAVGSPSEGPLVTIYASRGEAGAQLREVERESKRAIVEAGALLGFPPCCVDAFAATFEVARMDQDTINDDAVRSLLAETQGAPGRQALDPLHDLDLLAFYPCSPTCVQATAFADRTFAALEATQPAVAARARRELGAPVLFWRLPFYLVFVGAQPTATGVRYDSALVHTFPDPEVTRIQRLFGGLVLPTLDLGDHVTIEDGDVVVSRGTAVVARLPSRPPPPPESTARRSTSATGKKPRKQPATFAPLLGTWDRSL